MRIKICAALLIYCLTTASLVRASILGVSFDSGDLYNISTSTASLSLIGNTGVSHLAEIEFAPNGQLYGFTAGSNSQLYQIDPLTAVATAVGPLGSFIFEGGLAFSPGGTAYGVGMGNSNTPELFTINLLTGSATPGPLLTGSHDINGIAWRSDGLLVGVDRDSGGLVTINPTTGATAFLASAGTDVGSTGGMTASGSTGYFSTGAPNDIVPGSNRLYQFDLTTGASTLIGTFSLAPAGGISGLATVPEPGALLMMALVLVPLTFRRCRPTSRVAAHEKPGSDIA